MNHPPHESKSAIEHENARLRGDLLTISKRYSHDLRTPLGGILSAAEAIHEVLKTHDPSAVSLADSVLRSADEISQLIKQLSFVTRASANPLPKVPVHMAEPVFVALQRLESRIFKTQARVKEPASWPVVPGVPAWLEMVWWNFLVNALKYGGPAPQVELGWTGEKNSTCFWIIDRGPGVPEMFRDKLFMEFHRLHEEPGVPGLGLSIVQRLVELQGGRCGCEFGPAGTRFFFSLPVDSEATELVQTASLTAQPCL